MNPEQIIIWLRGKAKEGTDHASVRMLNAAADTIEALQAELRDEMHRHDRLQDFEVAEAQQLAELRAAHRWIPVTERLPEKDVPVLVLSGGHCYVAEWYTWHVGSIGINSWSMPQYVAPPSHWMPLPEPPKGE